MIENLVWLEMTYRRMLDMTTLKTQPTQASVADFLNAIPDEQARLDCWEIAEMMAQATKAPPEMWGASIVGFGRYRYHYASGRTGEWMLVGFSPRKQNITLYLMSGFEQYAMLLEKLGQYRCGKACLYIKRLAEVHRPTLKKLIQASVKHMRATNPPGKGQPLT